MFILFSLLVSQAFAGGLEWSWPNESPVKYQLDTVLLSPQGQVWPAEQNIEAQVFETQIRLEVACTGRVEGKGWAVGCSLDDVKLSGNAVPGKEQTVQVVLQEYTAELTGKVVSFRMGSSGRLRKFDIEGVETRNSKHGIVVDHIRQILRRTFTPFDLQLPKNGDDKGKKWSQKGSPMVFELMSAEGTAGGVSLKHKVTERDGDVVRIDTSGRAAVIDGAVIETGTSSMVRISAVATSQFDTARGVLDWSHVSTQTDHATSNLQGLSKVKPASFSSRLGRINQSGEVLMPSL